jgi:hypothetical protein
MAYYGAQCRQSEKDEALRIYVSDCLMIMTKNTAQLCGGQIMSKRYTDILNGEKEEKRTPEEIINGIKAKCDTVREANDSI